MQFKLFSLFAILATSQVAQANPVDTRGELTNIVITINQLKDVISKNDYVWSSLKVTNYDKKYPSARDGLRDGVALASVTSQLCASVDAARVLTINRVAVCDSIYSYTNVQIKLLKTISSRGELLRVHLNDAEIRLALRNLGDLIDNLTVRILIPAKCDDRVRSRVQTLSGHFAEAQRQTGCSGGC